MPEKQKRQFVPGKVIYPADKDAIYRDLEPLSTRPPKRKPKPKPEPTFEVINYKPVNRDKWPAPEGWDPQSPPP